MLSSKSNNKLLSIAVCACSLLSFLYGAITVRYKIFPYNQLRFLKQNLSPLPSLSYSDYFYQKKSFFEQHGGNKYDVVMIGDSHIDGAEWEDMFPSLRIANRGIGEDRTDGVLKRMNSIYSTNAKKAFIMIGRNDFADGVEINDVINNYKNIIHKLTAHGMQVYVQSSILQGNRYAPLNIKIMTLNDQLKKLAIEDKSFTYIDLNVGLAKGSVLDSKYSRDDIHLNGSGYAVWKDIISSYIQ